VAAASPTNAAERIFEPFFRRRGGTGLGLFHRARAGPMQRALLPLEPPPAAAASSASCLPTRSAGSLNLPKPNGADVDDEPDLCELLSITLGRMAIDSHAVHDIAGGTGRTACSAL